MTITSTPTAEKLGAALAENPGNPAKALAIIAGIGASTAGKLLAAWEADGHAIRYTSDTSRATLWYPVRLDAVTENETEPGETAEVVTTAAEAAYAALDADDQDGLVEALLDMGVPATDPVAELAEQLRALDPATATERLAQIAEANTKDSELAAAQAADAAEVDEPAPAVTNRATSDELRVHVRSGDASESDAEPKERLRPGGLRGMVEQWLADNPDTEISPSRLGRILDRSSGAVANALAALTDAEVAVRTSDKPKRYQHAADA